MDLACREQCEVADPCQLPDGWLNPTGQNGRGADDAALVDADVSAHATPGTWVELFPADPARNGAAIQNKDAAAIIYFVEAATAPASGTAPGEIGVPVFPGYYKFDWAPQKRYFFRSTVAASKVSVKLW